ncbi:hypothetical protein RRF57_011518 [Xylaria bambusicola]|uniref:Uncharacterized protein n=1 Tax=Xylaria bambusicola TaxID=326684 RepID=A0AAN7V0J6_9PEZI
MSFVSDTTRSANLKPLSVTASAAFWTLSPFPQSVFFIRVLFPSSFLLPTVMATATFRLVLLLSYRGLRFRLGVHRQRLAGLDDHAVVPDVLISLLLAKHLSHVSIRAYPLDLRLEGAVVDVEVDAHRGLGYYYVGRGALRVVSARSDPEKRRVFLARIWEIQLVLGSTGSPRDFDPAGRDEAFEALYGFNLGEG